MLRVKARLGTTDDYLEQLRCCYLPFCKGRFRRALASFTTAELEQWIESLELSPWTCKGRILYLRFVSWNRLSGRRLAGQVF